MQVEPTEICVVQRGIVMQVELLNKGADARGYVLEVRSRQTAYPQSLRLGPCT